MNKNPMSKIALAAVLFGAAGVAQAGYIGKFSGNDVAPPGQGDKAANIEAALASVNIDFGTNVLFYDTAECNSSFVSSMGLSSATGCPGASGKWWTQMPIDYLSVKAGNEFTLYSYEPAANNGDWSTDNLVNCTGGNNNNNGNNRNRGNTNNNQEKTCNNRDVSHISFWYKERLSVSEPGAILLMGLGLLGLGLASRKPQK